MHLCYYVRRHTLDDKGEVGLTLLLPPDRNRCWRVRRSAAALS